MSKTITVPDFWVLFTPEGKADGSLHGSARYPTAEAAWATFEHRRDRRERFQRQGWQILPVEQADWLDYWEGRRNPVTESSDSGGAS